MRFLHLLLLVLVTLFAAAQALRHDRHYYEQLLQELDAEVARRDFENMVLERRRRSSEKKSYPRNCYFSPIQCLFTRT